MGCHRPWTKMHKKVRNDLSFDESIVLEPNFGRKKLFFTVLYRSPAFNHTAPEFQAFLLNFENLYSRIKTRNPLAMFFTGDFNGHTTNGTDIDELFTNLGLSQVISEPTNFEPHKNPSCIDLLVADQPNIILDSGTRASLDSYCHFIAKLISKYHHRYHLRERFGITIGQTRLLLKGV